MVINYQSWFLLLYTSVDESVPSPPPLMVPCVPTGMKTGVSTSPCGSVTVLARARPQVASRWKTKGGRPLGETRRARIRVVLMGGWR